MRPCRRPARTSTLKFESADADSSACGIAIDDVSVIESGATPPAAAPGVPQLFGAVPDVQPVASGGSYLGLAGVFTANPNEADLSLRLFSNATCDGAPGQPIGTKTGLAANPQGFAAFAVDDTFPNLAPGTFVSAQSRRGAIRRVVGVLERRRRRPEQHVLALGTPGRRRTRARRATCPEPGRGALVQDPDPPEQPRRGHALEPPDGLRPRHVQRHPGGLRRVERGCELVGGPGLAQNDLTKQAASVPTDAFNTSQYDSVVVGSAELEPRPELVRQLQRSQWSASQWSASQWSASQWSASQWSASQWSASQWSASQWSASQWSASQWSASQWSASQWSGPFEGDP